MIVKCVDIWRLKLSFQYPVKHKLATYGGSENLVVKITLADGSAGYGEGVPRAFVTGESLAGAHSYLVETLAPAMLEASFASAEELFQGLAGEDAAAPSYPSARCALETALFDAAGRSWGKSMSQMLGGAVKESVTYSAVLPLLSPRQLSRFFQLVKEKRLGFVKLKVGEAYDLEVLDLARRELGWLVDIRVDANGAWTAEEALIRLQAMLPYGISAVEQPVAKEDYEGLRRVSQALEIPVIADESLCSEADAQRLIDLKACRMFNIRLSKCGGLSAARRIRDLAQEAGIACQLGCHVGETSILAAAGRHFALCSRQLAYVEGSFAPYLLNADPVEQPVVFQDEGAGPTLPGAGLGVTVREDILMELAGSHIRLA
jgi:L-Ala-D/L-Glu epimerase